MANQALSLYRRLLKNQLDWTINKRIWRKESMKIRHAFEMNRDISDPRLAQKIIVDGERYLESVKHPDPFVRKICFYDSEDNF